jgi:hypothetical protein
MEGRLNMYFTGQLWSVFYILKCFYKIFVSRSCNIITQIWIKLWNLDPLYLGLGVVTDFITLVVLHFG